MTIDYDAMITEVKKGWCKGMSGAYLSTEGEVCIRGAALRLYGFDRVGQIYPVLDPIIRAQYPDRIDPDDYPDNCVHDFNDHEKTTLDDVVAVLEKARAG